MNCARCGTPCDDWTPGCRSCCDRHRKRALRSGDPAQVAAYRRTARESFWRAVQDTARRVRDGEIIWALPRRGAGGRFVAE